MPKSKSDKQELDPKHADKFMWGPDDIEWKPAVTGAIQEATQKLREIVKSKRP